jgi:hypothetical protein
MNLVAKRIFAVFGKKFVESMINYILVVGTTLAILLSWTRNASILQALLHGGLGWIYVFYVTDNKVMFIITLGTLVFAVYKLISLMRAIHGDVSRVMGM